MDDQAVKDKTLQVGFWFTRIERGAYLANKLSELGCSVTMYHDQDIPNGKYNIKHVKYGFFSGLSVLFKSNQEIYFSTGLLLPSVQLTILKIFKKTPFVLGVGAPYWRTYNTSTQYFKNMILTRVVYPIVFRIILYHTKDVITNSRYLQNLMNEKYPSCAFKTKNIYNGVNYKKFAQGPRKRSLSDDTPLRIISIGTANYTPKTNGLIFLVETIAKLVRNIPSTTFTILVKSVNSFEQMRLVESIPIDVQDSVKIIFNSDAVSTYISESNLFIYSTPVESSDSLPRVLIEAQAMGIPTITTNTVGCPEVVLHEKTGMVVGYDSDAIINAIQSHLNNMALSFERANLGMNHVRRRFSWNRMAVKYHSLLTK